MKKSILLATVAVALCTMGSGEAKGRQRSSVDIRALIQKRAESAHVLMQKAESAKKNFFAKAKAGDIKGAKTALNTLSSLGSGCNPAILASEALITAAHNGNLKVAQFLCENLGADTNFERLGDDKQTPLMAAARAGKLEMVKFLLDKGADIKKTTQRTSRMISGHRKYYGGKTAIDAAKEGGKINVINYLINYLKSVQ